MFSKLGTALIFLVFLAASATAEDFGTFNGELVYKAVPGKERVVETVLPFSFVDTKGKIWTVPVGSEVDGASIPSAFWSLIGGPFTGKYREASVVHDHFCKAQTETWQDTHRVFYDGMRANGVDETLATTMYGAVYFRGPRWVVTKAKTPRKPAVSGTPLQIGSKKIDIVALAAKPGITPEQVRTAIDDALAIDQESAFVKRLLAKKADCSLVVESLDSSDASFAMCELAQLLACRYLQFYITSAIDLDDHFSPSILTFFISTSLDFGALGDLIENFRKDVGDCGDLNRFVPDEVMESFADFCFRHFW